MEKKVRSIGNKQKLILFFLVLIFIISFFSIIFEIVPTKTNSLSLPSPDLRGYLPLNTAINQTKNTKDLSDIIITNKTVSQLLWALQGVTHGPGFRTVPSAGGTFPLKIYLIHNTSFPFKEGNYHYVPNQHQLKRVSSLNNYSLFVSSFFGDDIQVVSNVSNIFLILADYKRTTDRYGLRGIQYVHLEVGHALQNFLLQLTSLNLNTRVITNFFSEQIQTFLNTDLQPLAVLPLGINGKNNVSPLKMNFHRSTNAEEITVEQAIAKRKSIRDYLDGKIPLTVIFDVLKYSTIISSIIGDKLSLNFHVVAGNIEGIPKGLFSYKSENFSLNQISDVDLRSPLKVAGLNQQWIESAQLDLVISANITWVNEQSDQDFYHRIMMHTIGMIAQNVYLKCAAHGLGTVVVGAFNERSVSELLNISFSFTPIYIMPIGLTPEFFEEPIFQIPLTQVARFIGFSLYFFIYVSLFLSIPMFKRRLLRRIRWFHCIFGSIPLLGVFFHFLAIHGHVNSLSGFISVFSYWNALNYFIINIISIPKTRYELGMFLANLSIILGTIVVILGFLVSLKLVKYRKIAIKAHKYAVFFTIAFVIFHNLLNGTMFANKPILFISLNIFVLDLYFLLLILPNLIINDGQKEIVAEKLS